MEKTNPWIFAFLFFLVISVVLGVMLYKQETSKLTFGDIEIKEKTYNDITKVLEPHFVLCNMEGKCSVIKENS